MPVSTSVPTEERITPMRTAITAFRTDPAAITIAKTSPRTISAK